MVPTQLVYRIYGDNLAVVMDVRRKHAVLLQGDALALWKRLLTKPSNADVQHPLFRQLARHGLVAGPAANTEATTEAGAEAARSEPAFDLAVLNLWAFRNRVPLAGHFELTGRCNLRCKHCYCLFEHRTDTLATEQVLQILDQLRDSGTFGLVLTGGEVFFRKDILTILDHLQHNKFVVRINTNGTLLDDKALDALAGYSNIYRVHISLYGPDAATHDRITHSRGSFDKTLAALRQLQGAGLSLRINCSLMQSNYSVYRRVETEIGDPLGIPVHFDSEIFPRDDGSTDNQAEALNPAQTEHFMYFRDRTRSSPPGLKKPKLCKAGFSFFSICEDGRVYPCLKMKRFYRNPLGDLRTESFQDLWTHSSPINKIRSALSDKLRDCNLCDLTI